MSFSLDAVRKYGPPLEQRVNELSKQLAKAMSETNKIETDDVVGLGDSDHSLVKYYDELNFAKTFDTSIIGTTGPKLVFEPDYDKLTLWLKYNHLGWDLTDYSGFNNNAEIFGSPCLTSGIDVGYLGGSKQSVAHDAGEEIYYEVPDNTTIQVTGISTGISFFDRVKFKSFTTQNGADRVLMWKIDDVSANNGFYMKVMDTGKLRFYIKRAGTEYKVETVTPLSLDTAYDLGFTYTVAGNLMKVYVDGIEQTYTSPAALTWPDSTLNMVINRRTTDIGCGDTDRMDTRVYREKVLSQTHFANLFTNKISISTALFGEVAVTDGSIMPRLPMGDSFTSTSFTTTSFS